jgi:hypothetical protein
VRKTSSSISLYHIPCPKPIVSLILGVTATR